MDSGGFHQSILSSSSSQLNSVAETVSLAPEIIRGGEAVGSVFSISVKQWALILQKDIMDGSRILIFMDTKKGCDQITRQLRKDGWPALSIHGDKSQSERDWVLSEFRSGKNQRTAIARAVLKDPAILLLDDEERKKLNWLELRADNVL